MSPEEMKRLDADAERYQGILVLLKKIAQGTTTRDDRDKLAEELGIDPRREGRK